MDAFDSLCDVLSEMQMAMSGEYRPGDDLDEALARNKAAADFRQKMWAAIAAYRDSYRSLGI